MPSEAFNELFAQRDRVVRQWSRTNNFSYVYHAEQTNLRMHLPLSELSEISCVCIVAAVRIDTRSVTAGIIGGMRRE